MRTHWLAIAMLAALAPAARPGEGPGDAALEQRIAELCSKLGEGQYGNKGACQELIEIGEPAMDQLLEALQAKRPQARWWAVAAVSRIGTDRAFDAVLDVLRDDPNAFVRSTAAYYLRHFRKKGKDVWPHVEKALDDPDPEVGRWALRLMVEDGYPELDSVLRKVLREGAAELRAYALGHIRDLRESQPEAARDYLPLVRGLLQPETSPRVRYDALHTAVTLMEEGHLAFLRKTYEEHDHPAVRECVLRCITILPEPPVEAFELFVQGLHSEDAKVRETASKLLRKAYNQYFGYDAKQPLPIREAAIAKWEAWYRKHYAQLRWHPERRNFVLLGQEKDREPGGEERTPPQE
ncbi:MAG: HEAT repeat domain-containing protein [Candidatus Brocadiia bacterium]